MATKTIYMNGDMNGDMNEDESGYVYPDSDVDDQPGCIGSECSDQEQGDAGDTGVYGDEEEYPEFYENLQVLPKPDQKQSQTNPKIKNKARSMSIDSESSDITKRPNFKCGSCKKSFLLDKNQKMIRCSFCGYRILFKLRTRAYITYKTE
jgi:DNA-directed RNA polymerase subunit RPC12/RpoP